MKISKSLATLVLAGTAGAFALSGAATTAEAKLKSITIGSNPAGSAYFLIAGGFAKLFQENLKIRSTGQPHAGSSVYLPLMDKGEITLGLNSSLDSGMAYKGAAPYKSAMKNVRTIARVWILPYMYIVKENSGLKTIADLKGKKVVVNFKTNVSLGQANRAILATAGLSENDVKSVDAGGVVSAIAMVVEGRADSTTVALTMPAMRKAHASVPGGLRVLSLGPKGTDEFMEKGMSGLYTQVMQPGKRIPFVRGATKIATFDTYLNAGSQVSDEDAYNMAKALHQHWKKLQKDIPPLRAVKAEQLVTPLNPIPYHRGAAKYYKEVGLWTAANEKHDAGRW
ncbi:MAG: TAXI family TRAP transporter solute-binding subunit [Rhodospirillales bacterium]|nr:TAXI family TRAP transporter solute-binding subunit [Rhodospirillales bacterium]